MCGSQAFGTGFQAEEYEFGAMGLTLELSRASNRNSEARDAKRKSESENQAQEVSEDNKNSIRN